MVCWSEPCRYLNGQKTQLADVAFSVYAHGLSLGLTRMVKDCFSNIISDRIVSDTNVLAGLGSRSKTCSALTLSKFTKARPRDSQEQRYIQIGRLVLLCFLLPPSLHAPWLLNKLNPILQHPKQHTMLPIRCAR